MRITVITLDAHLAPAFERARARLAREIPGFEATLHTAATWGAEPLAAERARAEVARADIIIATHLFVEDQIREILPAIEARQDRARAVACLMSASQVMRQTRLGKFRMGG